MFANAINSKTTILNYGLLSGENIELSPHNVIFKEMQVKGFWLSIWLEKMSNTEKNNLYHHLQDLIIKKIIHTNVEKVYNIEEIVAAIHHAEKYGRSGKILVTPNPHILEKIKTEYN